MYKEYTSNAGIEFVVKLPDGPHFAKDLDNTDYQAYLKFLDEGGQPLPADEGAE